MELVREQIQQLQETHGTAAPALTFTGGALQAVRPEETAQAVSVTMYSAGAHCSQEPQSVFF